MSCQCSDETDYECSGPGASILENTSLTWLKTVDPLLGTTPDRAAFPDGNINDLFWKLLQNDCSIANYVQNLITRTFGVVDGDAPAQGVVPDPLIGAPETPTQGAVHTVVYTDFEVIYYFNPTGDAWEEVGRMEKLYQTLKEWRRTVTIPLEENDTEVAFSIPTTDDNDLAFAFAMADLTLIYVDNADTEMPFVGIVPGFNVSGAVVRVTLSAPLTTSAYSLVAIFKHLSGAL
jgi:hypothetical protein